MARREATVSSPRVESQNTLEEKDREKDVSIFSKYDS